jgi:hypothetical protein
MGGNLFLYTMYMYTIKPCYHNVGIQPDFQGTACMWSRVTSGHAYKPSIRLTGHLMPEQKLTNVLISFECLCVRKIVYF